MAHLHEQLATLEAAPMHVSDHTHLLLPLTAQPDLPLPIPTAQVENEIHDPMTSRPLLPRETNHPSETSPTRLPPAPAPLSSSTPPLVSTSEAEDARVPPPTHGPHTTPTPKDATLPVTNPVPVAVTIQQLVEKIESIMSWQEVETRMCRLEEKTLIKQPTTDPITANQGKSMPSQSPVVPSPSQTLILGDSNLSQLCTTDLKNCRIRTLKEANVSRGYRTSASHTVVYLT